MKWSGSSSTSSKSAIPAASPTAKARIHASTGTQIVGYQGYQDDKPKNLAESSESVEIELGDLGGGNGSLFFPFTTTLIEIILNREPLPLNRECDILKFLDIVFV